MIFPFSLVGRFIRLTPLRIDDLDGLCAIGLEPVLWQSTTIQIVTRSDMEAYVRTALEAQDRGAAMPFAIYEQSTGKLIGSTRFHSIDIGHRHLEIGFTWLGLPWQRTSANTEAKYLMLGHAFASMGCIRVEFRADIGNEKSKRALTRIGASEEGILRHFRISPHRGVRDMVIYSILREEWPQVKSGLEAKLG